jgi:cytochrome c-type biogenesis protein CcmF
MIAELGQLSLILALILAVLLASLPMIGAWRGNDALMKLAPSLATGQFVFLAGAFAALATAFLQHDFTVTYVAMHSNLLLPWYYRLTAVWGSHEGSLLLWMLLLGGWTLAVAVFSRSLPKHFVARVLAVMGFVSVGFLLFILLTSNPFERILPGPIDGRDLNPLLQDPGMIFHPPLLYMGYVGFAVAFAFAIAGLIGGKVERDWVRWARPWTLAAWAFLTFGIALGSWWAYYELGWGGWWFWDPVENASFIPWLIGTALIHTQAVTEKRGAFPAWTVLLSIAAFSMSLLGTFLVRSGVLTSVHAFANDPERGLFILAFMGVVTGGALLLYALRAPRIMTGEGFDWISRESALLLNNVFFTVSAAMVLLGTLYPLIIDFMGWGQISVGAALLRRHVRHADDTGRVAAAPGTLYALETRRVQAHHPTAGLDRAWRDRRRAGSECVARRLEPARGHRLDRRFLADCRRPRLGLANRAGRPLRPGAQPARDDACSRRRRCIPDRRGHGRVDHLRTRHSHRSGRKRGGIGLPVRAP